MKKIKTVAVEAARKAGKVLLKEFKNFDRDKVKFKHKHEIVTRADLKAEKILLREVRLNFPDHRIISEEKGEIANSSDYLWVIDPLDGTTNFSMHNPLWSISLGVAYKDKLVLGLIYIPYLEEMFLAEKGGGAFLNGKRIKVSKIEGGKAINTFCHGRRNEHIEKALSYYSRQKLRGFDCRQLGSAAAELAFVACGRTESITIPGANPWDVAAGALLVREAAGRVTDFSGKPWGLGSDSILASNGRIHVELLKVIKQSR